MRAFIRSAALIAVCSASLGSLALGQVRIQTPQVKVDVPKVQVQVPKVQAPKIQVQAPKIQTPKVQTPQTQVQRTTINSSSTGAPKGASTITKSGSAVLDAAKTRSQPLSKGGTKTQTLSGTAAVEGASSKSQSSTKSGTSFKAMSTSGGTPAIEGASAGTTTPPPSTTNQRPTTQSPTASGTPTPTCTGTTCTVSLGNGVFGSATANPNGTFTVSNNFGTVTLTQAQLQQVARGDLSPVSGLMGNMPSASIGNNTNRFVPGSAADPWMPGGSTLGRIGDFLRNDFTLKLPSISQVGNIVGGSAEMVAGGALTATGNPLGPVMVANGADQYVAGVMDRMPLGQQASRAVANSVGAPPEAGDALYLAGNIALGAGATRLGGAGAEAGTIARGAGTEGAVANPVPETMARVIPGEGKFPTLGPPGKTDVFVTDAKAIEGLSPAQISERLAIPPSNTYTVVEFKTPSSGVASPINRTDPGFIGGGRTAGGAPEFVIPNGPIPEGAAVNVVRSGGNSGLPGAPSGGSSYLGELPILANPPKP
jgi:Novel toxin 10